MSKENPNWEIPRTKIKLRVEHRDSQHVHFRVFAGQSHNALALAGILILNLEEFQVFTDALRSGAASVLLDVEIEDKLKPAQE